MNHSNRTLEYSLKVEEELRVLARQQPRGKMGFLVDGQGRKVHSKTIKERFYEKVNKAGPVPIERPELGPCWLWTAKHNKDGYGRFAIRDKEFAAHRVSYTLEFGSIADGLTLDHLCKVRGCVNYTHLEPVTMRINLLRGDTFQAANASKTTCVNGHPLTPENTRYTKSGRQCRECSIIRKQQQRRLAGCREKGRYKTQREIAYRESFLP